MKCDKVHTIFCVKTDNVDEVLRSQSCKISLIVDDTVVYRNSTDHSRTFMCQFLAERLCITMAGKIHDCFCAEINGTHNFLHFDIVVFAVAGNT